MQSCTGTNNSSARLNLGGDTHFHSKAVEFLDTITAPGAVTRPPGA